MHHRYIVVEGPIGVGKQGVVSAMVEKLSAQHVTDAKNPFLPAFYQDMEKYAFQAQLFFLLSRFHQQQSLLQQDLFSQQIICDYLFQKDRIFASLTLQPAEFALYETVYGLLKGTSPTPDIIVYLQASVDTLQDRISRKNNELALMLPKAYLQQVVDAYQTFFFHYRHAPIVVVDTGKTDFEKHPENIDFLLKKMSEIKSGLHYFNPQQS